jgi:hypothetical protein
MRSILLVCLCSLQEIGSTAIRNITSFVGGRNSELSRTEYYRERSCSSGIGAGAPHPLRACSKRYSTVHGAKSALSYGVEASPSVDSDYFGVANLYACHTRAGVRLGALCLANNVDRSCAVRSMQGGDTVLCQDVTEETHRIRELRDLSRMRVYPQRADEWCPVS